MLHVKRLPLNQPASDRIKRWLGGEGARDFMDWLVALDAILTAESGNLLARAGDDESLADEARVKANEAAEIRRFIERINAARESEFQFERCEIMPTTISVIPTT